MKTFLLLIISLLLTANVAFADHIGIFRDATAQSCNLNPDFNNSVVLMHQFATGSTGVQLKVDFSHAPGSTFLSFDSPFYPVGSLTTSLSVGYNWCETGNFVIGIITAILNPGYIEVVKADGYSVLFQEGCDFTGYPVTGGKAYIGAGECDPGLATEPSTWGQVKALYR